MQLLKQVLWVQPEVWADDHVLLVVSCLASTSEKVNYNKYISSTPATESCDFCLQAVVLHKHATAVQTGGTGGVIACLLTSSTGEHDSSQTEQLRGQRQRSAAVRHLQRRQAKEGHCGQRPERSGSRE